MSYTKTNWENLPSTNTPVNVSNLNKIENELESLDKNTIYSTTEQKIGTWISGKPVYRKVITSSTAISSNETIEISHNIANLDLVTKCDVMIYWSTKSIPVPSYYEYQNRNLVIREINSSKVKVTSYGEGWGGHTLYIILEYTKTTD